MTFNYIQPEKIKAILFLVLFLIIVGLLGLYYFERLTSGENVVKDIRVDSKASFILNRMQHTSTRNGVREWILEASSARVLKNENKAVLKDISVVFFLSNIKEKVVVTAKEGCIDTKENNIDFSDNVIVKYGESVLKTHQLHYEKKSHIVYSKVHVTVTNNDSILESDTLTIDLNKNTLLLKGHFLGTFSEALDFLK